VKYPIDQECFETAVVNPICVRQLDMEWNGWYAWGAPAPVLARHLMIPVALLMTVMPEQK
jgi:hypothetical protein